MTNLLEKNDLRLRVLNLLKINFNVGEEVLLDVDVCFDVVDDWRKHEVILK